MRGVIVFMDPRNFTIRDEPGDVGVTTRFGFNRSASSLPVALPPQHVAAIFGQVRRSTTRHSMATRDH